MRRATSSVDTASRAAPSSSGLRIRLLGGIEIEASGKTVPVRMGARARELLCFLALHPGPHARGELATRFWPDVLDRSARASLRTALHGLRRGLEGADDHLLVSRDGIGLDDGVWVDARAVAKHAERGQVREALALCRGDLLPGLEADWAVRARDEHRELVCDLHERLAAEADARGEIRAALRSTREQVALEPLSEESSRRLMRRLAVAGDRPAALAAYSRLEERLRVELGVAPSPATRELAAELRTGRAVQAHERSSSASRPEAVSALDEALDAYRDAVGAIAAAVDELQDGEAEKWLDELVRQPVMS